MAAGRLDPDLRQAVRALRRTPGFTLVAVGTLGLALGANAGIFTMVDAVLLRPLRFPRPERPLDAPVLAGLGLARTDARPDVEMAGRTAG